MKIKFPFKVMTTNIDKLIENLKTDVISNLNSTISDDIASNKENITMIIQHLEDLKILLLDKKNRSF